MKERFVENGIEYVRNGDCYIQKLTVPDDKSITSVSMAGCTQYLSKKTALIFIQLKCMAKPDLHILKKLTLPLRK